ncbi:MAG: hypothetical protein QOG11_1660 [Solirubrobacteraceae bacterium]|nr:hypothetical protein [Solirubrobacteraceae bacterium]
MVSRFGGPEVLVADEVPEPAAGAAHGAIERRDVFGKTLLAA